MQLPAVLNYVNISFILDTQEKTLIWIKHTHIYTKVIILEYVQCPRFYMK